MREGGKEGGGGINGGGDMSWQSRHVTVVTAAAVIIDYY
jgi:hypothetical protein